MSISRKSVRYCSVVLCGWIFLYVTFFGLYIIIPNQKKKLDNAPSYTDKERVIMNNVFNFKYVNILTTEHDDFINKIIKKVLEDNLIKNSNKNMKRSSGVNQGIASQKVTNRHPLQTQTNLKTIQSIQRRHGMAIHALKNSTHSNSSEMLPPGNKQSISNTTERKTSNPNSYYNYSKTIISPMNAQFLISNEHVCKSVSPDLIMLVPSSPLNAVKRYAIRQTYGSLSRDRKSKINGVDVKLLIRTVFLVGTFSNSQIGNALSIENNAYKDIIQIDFIDSYKELTKKVLYGLKWVNEFCPNVSYVMKVDDDVFVNTAVLTNRLQGQLSSKIRSVFGHLYEGYVRVGRSGKWKVTYDEFPLPTFPNYMSGTSYVMTSDLVPKILYSAQRLPYLSIEDAFITGVIANRIHGATMINWKDNSVWIYRVPNPCDFTTGHLSMTNITPAMFRDIWSILNTNGTRSNGTRCS